MKIMKSDNPALYLDPGEMLIRRIEFTVKDGVSFRMSIPFKTSCFEEAETFAEGYLTKYCHDTGVERDSINAYYHLDEVSGDNGFISNDGDVCPLCNSKNKVAYTYEEFITEVRMTAECSRCGAKFDAYFKINGFANLMYNPLADHRDKEE